MQPAPPIPRRPPANTLLLLALWIVFYASFTLFTPALLDDADSVHAEVAREMLLRHDWVTLYTNGIRYLEKAPLLYWSMAASYNYLGSAPPRRAFRSRWLFWRSPSQWRASRAGRFATQRQASTRR